MKKFYLFSMFVFGALKGIAQPILTSSTPLPAIGYTAPVAVVATVPSIVGNSGANQIWDFSTLTFGNVGTLTSIVPASTPISSSFASSNYALSLVGQNTYSFFKRSTDKMEVLAWLVTAPNTGKDYTPNPKTRLVFPFNFNDVFTDSYQQVGNSVSSVTTTYDGYGTLITPFATYQNVVRIKEDYGGGDVDYTWYSTNPVTELAIFDNDNNMLYRFDANITTSINEQQRIIDIQIFPNPCTSNLIIRNLPPNTKVTLVDALGRCLVEKYSSSNSININTKSFLNGLYQLIIKSDNYSHTQKIIVQH